MQLTGVRYALPTNAVEPSRGKTAHLAHALDRGGHGHLVKRILGGDFPCAGGGLRARAFVVIWDLSGFRLGV